MSTKITDQKKSNAAHTSWLIPLGIFTFYPIILKAGLIPFDSIGYILFRHCLFSAILFGVYSGVVGCFGYPKNALKNSLVPGIIGTGINIFILLHLLHNFITKGIF